MALFRLPPHYVFDYKPMYYDKNKERRETVKKQVRRELGLENDPEAYKYSIRFRRETFYQRKVKRGQNMRMLLILILLLIIAYLAFYTDAFDQLISKIVK